jgi:hypothetical protein
MRRIKEDQERYEAEMERNKFLEMERFKKMEENRRNEERMKFMEMERAMKDEEERRIQENLSNNHRKSPYRGSLYQPQSYE